MEKLRLVVILAAAASLWPLAAQPVGDPPGQLLGGSSNSPIKLEVFSDFQCPSCRDFYLGTIRQLLQEYCSKDKVCVIYHEFPLANHQYSRVAARYAEAASRLGQQKLLPVFDSLFTDQAQWSQDGSIDSTVAKALSKDDYNKLEKYLLDPSINTSIEREIQLGVRREVKSTPTMFLSYLGKQQKAEGVVTYLVLKQFIDQIVK